MHPCLNVDEVLRLLACKLVASGAKAAAVSLACCCRSFEDPLLDALWETQDGLLPLLKSLPGDVWKVEKGQFVSPLTAFIFSSDCSAKEVFRQTPNEGRVVSFSKIRSRNAEAQSGRLEGPSGVGCSASAATPHRQRTCASRAGSL